jgi:hypothetical protein
MPMQITCRACRRLLRVPENLLGRKVQCPACQAEFTAGPEQADQPPDSLEVLEEEPPPSRRPVPPDEEAPRARLPRRRRPPVEEDDFEGDWDDDFEDEPSGRRRRGRSFAEAQRSVLPPAICLLVTGLLALLSNLAVATYNLYNGPPAPPQPAPGVNVKAFQQGYKVGWYATLVVVVICAVASLFVIGGAVQMLRLRTRTLAALGSILAIVLIYPGCCLLGLPFGIWSIVVLNKPEVKDAFRVRSF